MVRYHDRCGWEPEKAKANLAKHGVSFADALAVLLDTDADRHHVEKFDDKHSQEEIRTITIGSDPTNRLRVLWIVWTKRSGGTRIISARAATPRERRAYRREIRRR